MDYSIFTCCDEDVTSHKKLFKHLNKVHFNCDKLKDKNEPFEWFLNGCLTEIRIKNSVMRHFQNKHPFVHNYYLTNFHTSSLD